MVIEKDGAELLRDAQAAEQEGHWAKALQCYEAALAQLGREGEGGSAANILRRIGIVRAERGEFELARESYEASLEVADRHGLRREAASTLICMAILVQHQGRMAEAEALYARSHAIAERIGDLHLMALVDQNLGTIANIRGDFGGALQRYRASLERHLHLGDDLSAARTLNNIGMAHADLEQWQAAETSFDEAFRLADRCGDANTLGVVQINRADFLLKCGEFERARNCCDQAFEIFGRLESQTGLAEAYKVYGVLYRETGKWRLADVHFRSAVEIARDCRVPLLEAESLNEWALVHLAGERNREALQALNSAHRLFSELHARRELLDLDQRLDGMEATYLRVVQAWGESIEGKDRYTAGHCERVANYACLLAEAVGITGRDLTWLRMGGYLHDVGKIAVPEEVLNKPGRLTPEEFAVMKSHTVEGDVIVAELNFPWDIRPVVRSHHERWDGSGYPDGLKGEEIPLTARILCLADVYDALTTTRSYRPAMQPDEALRIMEGDAGRIFDPELFVVFRKLVTGAGRTLVSDVRFPAFKGVGAVA